MEGMLAKFLVHMVISIPVWATLLKNPVGSLQHRPFMKAGWTRAATILRPLHAGNSDFRDPHQADGHETSWLVFSCKDSPRFKSAEPGKF